MGSKFSSGFTIIEVMLFLAITGLLLAGILANASSSLNSQHYRDGVEAVKDRITAQYAKVYSLTNDNSGANAASDPCRGTNKPRGASDCLYVGRLIEIYPEATRPVSHMRISPVVAIPRAGYSDQQYYATQNSSSASVVADSTNKLSQQYQVKRYTENSELIYDQELDWAMAAVPKNGTKDNLLTLSLLVLRSPVDGTVQTYDIRADKPDQINYDDLSTTADSNGSASRLTAAYQRDAKFCVADFLGELDPPQRLAIIVHKGATGPSDVESRLNDDAGNSEC